MTVRTRAAAVSFAMAATVLSGPAHAAGCDVDQPVPGHPAAFVRCTGVHVGMVVNVPSERSGRAPCVAGFAFADQYRNRYLTVPGSCILTGECRFPQLLEGLPEIVKDLAGGILCEHVPSANPEQKYKKPPVVYDSARKRIGVLVYAVNVEDPAGRSVADNYDLALVRLDRTVRLDPRLPFFGGPTRLGSLPQTPQEAYVYSPPDADTRLPNARGGPLVPRPDRGPDSDRARYHYSGVWPLSGQVLGSPVMAPDGTALGFYRNLVTPGWGFTTIGYRKGIDRAQRQTGLRLRILTGKLS